MPIIKDKDIINDLVISNHSGVLLTANKKPNGSFDIKALNKAAYADVLDVIQNNISLQDQVCAMAMGFTLMLGRHKVDLSLTVGEINEPVAMDEPVATLVEEVF